MGITIARLSEDAGLLDAMADWFSARWNIPRKVYAQSMAACVRGEGFVPEWYAAMEGDRVVAGLGVIENDFHDRRDLTPNVCAVYTDPEYRNRGLAGALLSRAASDARSEGIDTLYLVTEHTSFYERYGWRFLCMAREADGHETRLYRLDTEKCPRGVSDFRVVDLETYYRRGIFRHFTRDCRCSTSITHTVDVTALRDFSRRTGTKFYLNFLYVLSKALNSRQDYRLQWDGRTNRLIAYDRIHPTQYVFHEDTETFTVVYTEYAEDYAAFYRNAESDVERAKKTREYGLDAKNHPNWFDASFIPWISYDSLNVELPDGNLYFNPIVNWGKYRLEGERALMPVTVRLNHAVADGYLVSKVFLLIEEEIAALSRGV